MKKGNVLLCLSFLISFTVNQVFGQDALKKVIPMSPTAASIAKYGDLPINYYSGSVNVSIPLFTVGSGNLQVPISLGYSFNGLKTEEIAGWTGLGWSLNGIGMIGRSVRGTADEGMNGYMIPGVMQAEFIKNNPTNQDVIENLKLAGKGLFDTEPDLFYYNLPGYSGKFYYNQTDQTFFTIPRENLNISFNSTDNKFTIVTPDGDTYMFSAREVTTTSGASCNGSVPPPNAYSSVTTAWYLTSIKNNEENRSITLQYDNTGIYNFEHKASESKYILTGVSGSYYSTPPDYNTEVCTQSSTINSQRIQFIYYEGGYLKFSSSTSDRCDLPGDKYLQKIERFNSANELIKKYVFNYGYFGDASGPAACNYPNNLGLRLKLTSIQEYDASGNMVINPYVFDYEENGQFPGRLSNAQDYWGYNNGAMSNQTLIPPFIYTTLQGTPMFYPGANRKPNFDGAKLGALQKITYPTKGSTEFEYENNELKDPFLEPSVQWVVQSLEGDHVGTQTYYEKTFTINVPPGVFNNNLGGAFVDVGVAEPGCDITAGTTCAILSLEGVTPGTNGWGYLTTYNMTGFYLPNGTYRMKAVFNQVPAMFQDFYYYIRWQEAIYNQSYLTGGIRIKKTTDFDGISHLNDLVKNINYTSDEDGLSSGKVFSYPYDNTTTLQDEYWSVDGNCNAQVYYRNFIKRSSSSTYPMVNAGSGYVGYSQVNVSMGPNGEGGKNKFYYSNVGDLVNTSFPVFSVSRDWKRGDLIKQSEIDASGTSKNEVNNSYYEFDENNLLVSKRSTGLKVGFNQSISGNLNGCNSLAYDQRSEQLAVPFYNEYETITGRNVVSASLGKLYENGIEQQRSSQQEYSYKNYLPISESKSGSNGIRSNTLTKYNTDYTLNASTPQWIITLNQKKVTNVPVEQLSIVKNASNAEFVVGGVVTVYRSDRPLPSKIYVLETKTPIPIASFTKSFIDPSLGFVMDSRYKESVSFLEYDDKQNLCSQQKTGDIITSFIWGYSKRYPVAMIIGKSYQDAITQSGLDMSVVDNPTSEQALRTELGKLRQLPDVKVKTLTYRPEYGVSSETDENGRTVFYEYDGSGRVSLLRDFEGNILKRYCYNYSGLPEECSLAETVIYYNDPQSGTFTRNNCTPGYTGTTVTYTVPANTYSSTIDKNAANALAINDVAANGQNYANVNGACIVAGCNAGNCVGDNKKCINGICETGVRVNTISVNKRGVWYCYYKYVWSDGSESVTFIETTSSPCVLIEY